MILYTPEVIQKCTQGIGKITEPPQHYSHSKHCLNPLCGDEITWYATIENQTFQQLHYTIHACILCMAAASIATATLTAQPLENINSFIQHYQLGLPIQTPPKLIEKLALFDPVHQSSNRYACIALPFIGLQQLTTQ